MSFRSFPNLLESSRSRPISLMTNHAVSEATSLKQTLPTRKALHPARKLFHFLTGFCFAMANENLEEDTWHTIVCTMFICIAIVEVMRIRFPSGRLNRAVLSAFRPFVRAHETHQFAGIAYYMFGVAFTSIVFPRPCATIGILSLASLDPIAALFGSLFEPLVPEARMRHGKSIAGFLFATAVAISLISLVFHQSPASPLSSTEKFSNAVIIGWAGALTEFLIPSPQIILGTVSFPLGIDDNAIIPIVSAATCTWLLAGEAARVYLSPLLLFRAHV